MDWGNNQRSEKLQVDCTQLYLVMARDTEFIELNHPRRSEIAKTNLGPYPEPLGLTLAEEDKSARFEYCAALGTEPHQCSVRMR